MPVYMDRLTGKLYKAGSPSHASDARLPQVDTELETELTGTPVHPIDTTAVKKAISKHWGGRRS